MSIHLGFGLYHHMLNDEHLKFAAQCGATHIVAHLVDYFGKTPSESNQPVGDWDGWGYTEGDRARWSLKSLTSLREKVESYGMHLHAIENFDPAHWYDILLDGPLKQEQMEFLKDIIRNLGGAGIPVMGYNFSIAGVAERTTGPFARHGAESVGMTGARHSPPIPDGMVWNMRYKQQLDPSKQVMLTHGQLWERLEYFLGEIIPVAEAEGVKLAAHPDDPPLPEIRKTPRLVYQPHLYDRLLDLVPSTSNQLELCLGSIAEMSEGNVYDSLSHFLKRNCIGYIHLRNVKGKVPHYKEVFLDDGDIDIFKIIEILKQHDFEGVIIPDHTPLLNIGGWHTGMAYAMGYLKSAIKGR